MTDLLYGKCGSGQGYTVLSLAQHQSFEYHLLFYVPIYAIDTAHKVSDVLVTCSLNNVISV